MSVMNTQRNEWQNFLDALPDLENVPVITEDYGDIENEVLRRLGALKGASGKVGICIILGTVNAVPEGNAECGPLLNMMHIARVIENVTINRGSLGTGTTYSDVVEKIAALTHAQFKPVSGNAPFMLVAPGIQEIDERFLQHAPTGPGKDVFFQCYGQLNHVLVQTAKPVITVNAVGANHTVTITCATPGAAVFYTVDGSKPRPGKTLYAAPVIAAVGVTVRARAWLAGQLASEIAVTQI